MELSRLFLVIQLGINKVTELCLMKHGVALSQIFEMPFYNVCSKIFLIRSWTFLGMWMSQFVVIIAFWKYYLTVYAQMSVK